jgi:hypothetical protein
MIQLCKQFVAAGLYDHEELGALFASALEVRLPGVLTMKPGSSVTYFLLLYFSIYLIKQFLVFKNKKLQKCKKCNNYKTIAKNNNLNIFRTWRLPREHAYSQVALRPHDHILRA